MPLRVELKPFERIIIGETVLINSGTRTSFLIDGEAPILRDKDTVTAETANTPVRRLYHCVQMMYLKNDIPKYRASYLGFVKDLGEGDPRLPRPDRHRQPPYCGWLALQGAQGNQEADEERSRADGRAGLVRDHAGAFATSGKPRLTDLPRHPSVGAVEAGATVPDEITITAHRRSASRSQPVSLRLVSIPSPRGMAVPPQGMAGGRFRPHPWPVRHSRPAGRRHTLIRICTGAEINAKE